jgi:hypothetical protein
MTLASAYKNNTAFICDGCNKEELYGDFKLPVGWKFDLLKSNIYKCYYLAYFCQKCYNVRKIIK